MAISTLTRTRFPSSLLVAVGLAAGFGVAAAGFVAEFVAAEDVAGLVVGGLDQGAHRGQWGQPARGAGVVDQAEHRPLLRLEGGFSLVLAVAGLGGARQRQ